MDTTIFPVLLLWLLLQLQLPLSIGVPSGCDYDGCADRPLYECSLHTCTTYSSIELSNSQLSGTIPDNLQFFNFLSGVLDLSNNELSGDWSLQQFAYHHWDDTGTIVLTVPCAVRPHTTIHYILKLCHRNRSRIQ